MPYEAFVADAQRVVNSIPKDNPVHARAEYLVTDVAQRAFVADYPKSLTLQFYGRFDPIRNFVATELPDRSATTPDTPLLDIVQSSAVAMVLNGDPYLYLMHRAHNPATPYHNGMVLLHELEHLTEREDRFPPDTVTDSLEATGLNERRAYKTNEGIYKAVDGDAAYSEYTQSLPFDILIEQLDEETIARTGNQISCLPINLEESAAIEPPQDTLLHAVWSEGGHEANAIGTAVCRRIIEIMSTQTETRTNKMIGWVLNEGAS